MGIEKIGLKTGHEIRELGTKQDGNLTQKAKGSKKIRELTQLVSKDGANAMRNMAEADALLEKRLGL